MLVLLLSTGLLYSADEADRSISIGVLGLNLNLSPENTELYFYGRVFNFLWHSPKGFGFTASPFVFYATNGENSQFDYTIVNASVFYNFFTKYRENLIVGPYVAVNAVNFKHPDFFEVRGGLMFSLRNIPFDDNYYEKGLFNSELITLELGYKYNRITKHMFYTQLGIDLVAVLKFMAAGREGDVQNYNKEHPRY